MANTFASTAHTFASQRQNRNWLNVRGAARRLSVMPTEDEETAR